MDWPEIKVRFCGDSRREKRLIPGMTFSVQETSSRCTMHGRFVTRWHRTDFAAVVCTQTSHAEMEARLSCKI